MKKSYLLWLPEDVHRDVKLYSAGIGMTMMEFIEQAVRAKIAKSKLAAAMLRLRAQEDAHLNKQKHI